MMRLAILLFVSSVAVAAEPSAKSINDEGYQLYKAKKYSDAVARFKAAIEADPRMAMPHYNLAATWGRMRQAGLACDTLVDRARIVAELEKAVLLDPARAKRMASDSDLNSIRDTVAYQKLTGADPETKKGLMDVLTHVNFWASGNGAQGSQSGLKFLPDGKVERWDTVNGAKKTATGTYKVEADAVNAIEPYKITVDVPKTAELPAYHFEGVLLDDKLQTLGRDSHVEFMDSPDECSA